VLTRRILDVLRRVEPKTVEMIFLDPVGRVLDEEIPHRVRTFEVDRLAPVVLVLVGEIVGRVLRDVVPVGSEVIVDDVEDDGDTGRVRAIDECTQILWRSVQPRRRVEIHAVVAPPEAAWKVRDRHHLDGGYPERREVVEMFCRRPPRTFRCERSHVHFVQHLAATRDAQPAAIGPCERGGIDDFGRAMRTVWLKA
jgi:hypothetical protein